MGNPNPTQMNQANRTQGVTQFTRATFNQNPNQNPNKNNFFVNSADKNTAQPYKSQHVSLPNPVNRNYVVPEFGPKKPETRNTFTLNGNSYSIDPATMEQIHKSEQLKGKNIRIPIKFVDMYSSQSHLSLQHKFNFLVQNMKKEKQQIGLLIASGRLSEKQKAGLITQFKAKLDQLKILKLALDLKLKESLEKRSQ